MMMKAVLKNLEEPKEGINAKEEPALHSIMYARQLAIQVDLKSKARILLPDSALLIGVIDEDGVLEADEIFV